jgi:4-phosphopantoate--beta-alanine ligase
LNVISVSEISPKHPRAESLRIRERLSNGFRRGLVIPEGLAAHGRGEAFDYILGERTTSEAKRAIRAAAATLLLASCPVISINGNVAALVPEDIIKLAKLVGARIEVNLFHGSGRREKRIAKWLRKHGAKEVLGTDRKFWTKIPEIHSDRRRVDRRGIAKADVVLVPLEDGDRTEALRKLGKCVIAIDLNPMSRTAQAADITIVDNITRAVPLMVKTVRHLSNKQKEKLLEITKNFNNKTNLKAMFKLMHRRLAFLGG